MLQKKKKKKKKRKRKFKANISEIKIIFLCLGNISGEFSANNMKEKQD